MSKNLYSSLILILLLSGFSADVGAYSYGHCDGTIERWRADGMRLRASRISFPVGGLGANALTLCADRWNGCPSRFDFNLTFNDGDVHWDNGQSEIWASSDDELLDGAIAVCIPYREDCHRRVESDIVFDVRFDWWVEGNNGYFPGDMGMYNGSEAMPFEAVIMHEMGHALCLYHENRLYNVMGFPVTHMHTNCSEARSTIGEDAATGAIFIYGIDPSAGQDLAVSHWKWIGNTGMFPNQDNDEYSVHGRTEIFDSSNNPMPLAASVDIAGGPDVWRSHNPVYLVNNGDTIGLEFTFENNGADPQTSVSAGYYLSNNDCLTTNDRRISGRQYNLTRDVPITSVSNIQLPSDMVENESYTVGVILDDTEAVNEYDEGNNATYIDIKVLPLVPISLTVSPVQITGGEVVHATVRLSGAATTGGTVVQLSSSSPGLAPMPGTVTVPQGQRQTSFSIHTAQPLCPKGEVVLSASRAETTVITTLHFVYPGRAPEQCIGRNEWLEWLDNLIRCVNLSGGPPGLPGDSPRGHRWTCDTPEICPECFFGLEGRPVDIPDYLAGLYGGIIDLFENLGSGPLPQPVIDKAKTLFDQIPLGRTFDSSLQGRVQAVLDVADNPGQLSRDRIGLLIAAVNAAELDVRLPDLSPVSLDAGTWVEADFSGVASLAVSENPAPGELSMTVRSGIPAPLEGFTPGWPVATYHFETADGHKVDNAVEYTINVRGLSFPGSPSELRAFAWNGSSYRDITTFQDHHQGVIGAVDDGLATIVVMGKKPEDMNQ